MNIKDFEYILEIAIQGSISKAADSLFITQPALTKFLQRVEHEIGTPIFHRVGKKFVPTDAGRIYLEKSESIKRINYQLEQEIHDIVAMKSGNIRIGVTAGRARYISKVVLPLFLNKYPDIKVFLEIRHTNLLTKMVLNNELDIVLINYSDEHNLLNYEIIGDDELVLAVSKNHHLIDKSYILADYKYPVVDELLWEDEKFVSLSSNSRSATLTNLYFTQIGVTPKIVAELQDIRAVIESVEMGVGISMFVSVPLHGYDGICYISLKDCDIPKQKAGIITRQGIYLNQGKRDFIELIKSTYYK